MFGKLGPRINDWGLALLTLEHRIDPLFRDAFNWLFQRPLAAIVQFLLRLFHRNRETRLCQEIAIDRERELTLEITDQMRRFVQREYAGAVAERAGNTKTYGVVKGEFEVLPDLPAHMRHGVFAHVRTFSVWIRFGGPGPSSP